MSDTERCLLTTKDYTILEVMLDRCLGREDPLASILRRKLLRAVVVFRDDIPPTVVTLNSRVTYCVDDGPAETRIVAHDEMRGLVGLSLPITNVRGLTLLGLAEGQSATVERADGRTETVTVRQVIYQPEAARREASQLQPKPSKPEARAAPFLRVVHRSDERAGSLPRHAFAPAGPDVDDPGPSAA